jgi:translation initiation factor IF-2
MTDITVKEFSKTVGLPVTRLIDQLQLAGVNKKDENDLISDEEKMQLLDYVRNNQAAKKSEANKEEENPEKIIDNNNDLEKQKIKTVVRKKKVFSKKNNQVTEKLEPKKAEDNQDDITAEEDIENKEDVSLENSTQKIEEETTIENIVEDPKSNNESENVNKKKKKKSKTKFINEEKSNVVVKSKSRRKKIHISDENRVVRRKSSKKSKSDNSVDDKHQFEKPTEPVIHTVELGEFISVSEIASAISVKSAEVIKVLMKMGVMATINESLDQDTATYL